MKRPQHRCWASSLLSHGSFYCCVYTDSGLRTAKNKNQLAKRGIGAVMGPNGPGVTQTTDTSTGGGSHSDLLVFSEEGPLVGAADVLEDPVHLLVLRLVSRRDQGAAAAAVGLPRLLHHLPEAQLLHLGQNRAVRTLKEEERPWASPAAFPPQQQHRGQSRGAVATSSQANRPKFHKPPCPRCP